jgi:hypothetical protein
LFQGVEQSSPAHSELQIVIKMEESQTIKNGRIYLENKRTIVLGISPGNPFFYKMENLQKMFQFAKKNSDQKVRMYILII